ncbi:hypothetical protein ABZ829_28055 [Streptomyces xanthochromogenes]|uniref:hypothetical protein n=1 Tax=Streptomyces xanthochromogenes TaxID=67384 RepID=UPI003423C2BC
MPRTTTVILSALCPLLLVVAAWRIRTERRTHRRQTAAAHLQQAALCRDLDAFTLRVQAALNARAVTAAADAVLDQALAAYSRHTPTRRGDDPWTR